MKKPLFIHQAPNLVTLANLSSGFIGILFLFRGEVQYALLCLALSAFFDLLDGFLARLLHAPSLLGGQLDSLADVVSFGCLPALMSWVLLTPEAPPMTALWPPLLYLLAAAVRLAIFNISPPTTEFRGMPVPAAALLSGSYILLITKESTLFSSNPYTVLWILNLAAAILMVLPRPMISIKFPSYSWRENAHRYLLLAGSILCILLLQWQGIFVAIVYYTGLSLLWGVFKRR